MTEKTVGVVAAKSLATLLFLSSISVLVSAVFWMIDNIERHGPAWHSVLVAINPLVYLGAAALLWKNANSFGPVSGPSEQPLTSRSALALCVVGVSIFTIYSHLARAIDMGIAVLSGTTQSTVPSGYRSWADLVIVIVAGLMIPFAWRQIIDLRASSDSSDSTNGR